LELCADRAFPVNGELNDDLVSRRDALHGRFPTPGNDLVLRSAGIVRAFGIADSQAPHRRWRNTPTSLTGGVMNRIKYPHHASGAAVQEHNPKGGEKCGQTNSPKQEW